VSKSVPVLALIDGAKKAAADRRGEPPTLPSSPRILSPLRSLLRPQRSLRIILKRQQSRAAARAREFSPSWARIRRRLRAHSAPLNHIEPSTIPPSTGPGRDERDASRRMISRLEISTHPSPTKKASRLATSQDAPLAPCTSRQLTNGLLNAHRARGIGRALLRPPQRLATIQRLWTASANRDPPICDFFPKKWKSEPPGRRLPTIP